MVSLVAWNQLIATSQAKRWPIDFALIYLEEAHAAEGWNFSNQVSAGSELPHIPYARTLEDRIDAAKQMIERYNHHQEVASAALQSTAAMNDDLRLNKKPKWLSPVYIDTMDNNLCRSYHALPERLYILRGPMRGEASTDGRIVYQGAAGPFGYSITDMIQQLRQESEGVIDMTWEQHVQ